MYTDVNEDRERIGVLATRKRKRTSRFSSAGRLNYRKIVAQRQGGGEAEEWVDAVDRS